MAAAQYKSLPDAVKQAYKEQADMARAKSKTPRGKAASHRNRAAHGIRLGGGPRSAYNVHMEVGHQTQLCCTSRSCSCHDTCTHQQQQRQRQVGVVYCFVMRFMSVQLNGHTSCPMATESHSLDEATVSR